MSLLHLRRLTLAGIAASVAVAAPARAADPVALPGTPLAVYVGELGQMQARLAGESAGIFFRSTSNAGDAGFFLAFPTDSSSPADLKGKVFGFDGAAGPSVSDEFVARTQGPVTGTGAPTDPFTQVTTYAAVASNVDKALVTQTTTYVNGTQSFTTRWDVQNVSGASLAYKALAAADFYFEGSDRGTGVFTEGPPRFLGGTNADSGRSGGFVEVAPPLSPAWSRYQALQWGSGADRVWGKVSGAATASTPTFDNTVLGDPVDNAGGVEWDGALTTPLVAGATATYVLVTRTATPAALQFSQTNAGSPQGVPITFSVVARDTSDVPYAGKTLRWAITGANPGGGTVVLDGAGGGAFTDPGTNAGDDTIVAFVDFNVNGVREAGEPQASALAKFIDNVPPRCTVKVSGDRPGGGGAGKPLVVTVACDSPATVATTTTFTITKPKAKASAAAKKKAKKKKKKKVTKIVVRLPVTRVVVSPGTTLPVKITVPKATARKYAGATVVAKVVITATDAAGNVAKTTATRTVKLATIKKAKKKRTTRRP